MSYDSPNLTRQRQAIRQEIKRLDRKCEELNIKISKLLQHLERTIRQQDLLKQKLTELK